MPSITTNSVDEKRNKCFEDDFAVKKIKKVILSNVYDITSKEALTLAVKIALELDVVQPDYVETQAQMEYDR